MWQKLYHWLFDVPERIKPSLRREYAISNISSLGGLAAHTAFILLFIYFEIWFLAYVNIASISLFAYSFILNKTRKKPILSTWAFLEVIIHGIIATVYLGWGTGFHYYLILVFQVSFLLPRYDMAFSLSITSFISYVFLLWFDYTQEAFFTLPPEVTLFFQPLNLISLLILTVLIAFYHKRTADDVENKLLDSNSDLQQRKEEVEQQSERILAQKEELTKVFSHVQESIRYAKRLQDAVLPSQKEINRILGEQHFIYYVPKDVVSGDFYWLSKQNNIAILAIGDCTGHGVSGAMLTMLGSSLLNLIVNEDKMLEPSQILQLLDKGVYNSLKQDEGETRDGMDISLCVFDFKRKKAYFAAAHHTMLCLQNQEMRQVKGDKLAIGGKTLRKQGQKRFTTHAIDIAEPTTLYFYTDGYQDQFGGEDNRKFMAKRFRAMLFEISQLPMPIQKENLQKRMQEWKGTNKQIDDILVMGLRLNL